MSVPENPTCEWCKHNDSEGTCQFHKFGTSDDVVACAEYEYDKEKYVLNMRIMKSEERKLDALEGEAIVDSEHSDYGDRD